MKSFFRAFLSLMLAFQMVMTSSGGVFLVFAEGGVEELGDAGEFEELEDGGEFEELEGEEETEELGDGGEIEEFEEEEGQDDQDDQDDQDFQEGINEEEEETEELGDGGEIEELEEEEDSQDSQDDHDFQEGNNEEEDLKDDKDLNDLKEGESDLIEVEQNGENVQNDNVIEEVEKTEEEILLLLEKAFEEGSLQRHLPNQIGLYLKNENVSEDMIRQILKRFPLKAERSEEAQKFQTETAVIPSYLLNRSQTGTVAPGISTQGSRSLDLQQAPVEIVSHRVLLKVQSRSVVEQMKANAEAEKVEVLILQDGEQPLLRIDSTDQTSTIGLLQKYLSHPGVLTQEPDYVYTVDATPNDFFHAANAWHHNNSGGTYQGQAANAGEDIQSHDAWDIFTGNGNVIVAVIDTGVMLNHPDLQNNLWDGSAACVDHNNAAISGGCPHNGFDYFDFDNNPSDESNHGTFVAGSAAAQGNNSTGVAGVNWSGTIMALKTGTADSNKLSGSAIINSINFAVNNGAKILNMSFSSSMEDSNITAAISNARDNGVLVIASAGNNNQDLDVQNAFPCETALDNILCIAATNVQGTLAFLGGSGGSNYGQTTVDIAAPGTHIVTTAPQHSDVYTNNFENGASDVAQFTFSGGGWGLKAGANNVLTTHTTGSYTNNESSFATLNQNFDLSSYSSGTLLLEMSCVTDDTFSGGFPVDGVGIDISTNGGTSYQEVNSFNGNLTTQRGLFDKGPNNQPLITIGLIDSDFVSNFTFRFHFFSNSSITGAGCDIDEVKLRVNSGDTYSVVTGTSFAAPIVAGLASLIWEFQPTLTFDQVRDQITAGGESLPALTTTTITGKRVNAYRSLALLADPAVVNLRAFFTNGGAEFADAASVSTTGPFFSWTAPTGQGIVSGYSFAVDGVPDAVVDTIGLNTTLSGLSQGAHTFQVFGVNTAGKTGTVAVFNFTVDTLAPDAPTGVALNGTNIVNDSNKAASTLTGTAAEAATLNYSISDGANPNVTGSQAVGAGAFTINSIDVTSLNEGSLTLSVTLTDDAGNISTAGTANVTKDIQISDPTNLQLNAGNPIVVATANSVDLTFDTTESGTASFSVSDGVNPAVTGTPTVTGAGTTTVSVNHTSLNDTTLTISLTFTDDAGNVATTVNANLLKDTQVSSASTLQINGGMAINASNVTNSTLTFDTTEAGSATFSISDGANPDITGAPAVTGAGTTSVSSLNLSSLNEGPLTLSVTFTDTVGNASTFTQLVLSKDTQIAAVTNVNLNGGTTILANNHSSVALTFDGVEAGSVSFSISDGVSPNVTGVATVTGAGTTTVNAVDVSSLDDGTLNLSVVFTDDAGNVASAGTGNVQKDAQIAAPTNVDLNGGTTINNTTKNSVSLVFDTVEAGNASFTISDGVNPDVTGTPAVSGAGTTTVNTIDVSSLDDGTLNISVVFTDTAGNVSTAGTANVQKDVAVATAGTVQLNAGADVNAGNVSSSSLTFTTTESGSATFSVSDGTNPDVTGLVTVTGAGTTTVSSVNLSPLDEGSLSLSVIFTDDAGNAASAGTGTAQKDTQVASVTSVQLNGGTTINGSNHSSVSLTFDGVEAGSVTFSVSDGVNPNVTGVATVTGAGTTTVNGVNVSSLDNGTLNVSVIFTDDAGNTAAAGTGNVLKDAQVPDAPTGVQLNGGTTINAATQTSVAITGSVAEAGNLLYSITDGVNPAVSGSQAVGAGAFTVSSLNVSSLDEGTLTVFVTLTDGSGNTSLDGNNTVLKDTQVSPAGSVQLNGGTTILFTNQNAVDLTFTTTEAGNASFVISDGVNPDVTGTLAVSGAGTTTVSNVDVSSLDDGTLNISVVFTDTAGNAASAGTGTVQKDAQVPSAPTAVLLNAGTAITAATANDVDLTGSVAESGTLSYSISDGVNPALTGTQAVGSGAFTVSTLNVSSLNDGTLNVSATLTDAAGNVSPAGTSTIQKDAQVPNAPTGVQLNGGTAINAATQTSVDITGSVAEAGTLLYSIIDGANPAVTGSQAVGAGAFTVSSLNVSTLDEGTLTVFVTLTDAVGNTSTDGNNTVQKDTQVSTAGTVQLNGGVTIISGNQNAVDLTFTTTEEGAASFTISDGVNPDVTGTPAVSGAGTTTVSNVNVSSLDDGTLNISVVFTDTAGNAASAGTGNVQKDSQVDAASAVQLNGGAGISAALQGSVALVFTTTEAGTASFTISDGVNPSITGTPAVSGAGVTTVNALDVTSLDDGTLNISVVFTDTAGNVATAGTSTVEKDTVAQTPTGLVLNNNQGITLATQSLVTFRATSAELGTFNFFFSDGVNPNVTGSQAVTSVGVVTVSNIDLSTMNEGTLNFQVTLTDSLGNVSLALTGTATKDTIVSSAASVVLNANSPIDGNSLTAVTLAFQALEIGSAVFVITDVNNNTVTSTVTVSSPGVITINNIDVTSLSDGLLTPAIVFTDSSGNVSPTVLGPAVQKDSSAVAVSSGGRRRRIVDATEEEPVEEVVEKVEPVSTGDGGGGGGSSSGSVLGANTVTHMDEEEEEEEPFVLPFLDVREQDDFYDEVKYLYMKDIVKGQAGSKKFGPDGVLDRAQALKMLLMLAGIEIPESISESPFLDVEISAWFAPIISIAKEMGYVNGYADGNFVPWQILNRAEALVLAYRILDVDLSFDGNSQFADVESDVWFADVLHDAVERGLLTVREEDGKSYADPTAEMTRAEFAELIVGLVGEGS